jgi:hypothetical protein
VGRESSRVKVEDILDDCLLFGARELKAGGGSFCAWRDSFGALIEYMAFNVKGDSSSAVASEFTSSISVKGKKDSPFMLY